MNKYTRCALTTLTVATGVALAGMTHTATAQAEVGPLPAYHWCPGDEWHPEWGDNWDGRACHDDHHRDNDGPDHRRDFAPARNYVPRFHWCPGEFWRPEWGFNFDWNACHDDHHRDGDGDNHGNDYWR